MREEPVEGRPRQRAGARAARQPFARPHDAQLREDKRDVGIGARLAGQNAQRLIERVLDEARHLGLVRKVETRIEIGLERKLAQQRQAEGIDRADGDVAEPIAQVDPAGAIDLRPLAGLAKLAHDPLAHFCGGLAREGNRQDVGRIDAALEQVDVARDEHRRLPGSRGGFEHDVVGRIDGKAARVGVGVGRRGSRRWRERAAGGRCSACLDSRRVWARRRATAAMMAATVGYSSPM